ncbi:MAG: ATP-binding protein [Rhodoferax sp.]|uniref:ATP-binding protein n=1 Tax=Rhodoferax sp. TaxID=50421 RepID=UPI00262DDF39|nr:ATP-binding protein [Rhodoferax sp.]MDD2878973.1 ATP-binding protein [Rhodoferax sp.]
MAQLMPWACQRIQGLAQRLLPDSLFGRLALLLVVAVVSSHVLALTLMFELNPFPPPHHSPPPPGHGPPPMFHVGLLMDITVRLLALVLAAWVGARWLSEPVRKFGQAAKELGRDIHRPAMPEEGTLECREAIRVFNQMQERMCLQLAQRDQFVAAVSHDLRTPLTRLTLRVQSLSDPQTRQSFGKDITEMDHMIRTTLDYLRGMADPEPKVLLDVGSLLTSLEEDFQDSGQDVRVQGRVAAAPLLIQASALRRCLGNLVENAVRYGKRARISLTDVGDQLQISVQDDGPGIAPGELDKVLAPFYRVESSRNRNSGGVGLGLASAHEFAQKHGGSLTLCNPIEGGLLATLCLPRQKPIDR